MKGSIIRQLKFLFFFSASLLLACNDGSEKKENSDRGAETDSPEMAPGDDLSGCYRRVIARDTFIARLQLLADSVTGSLLFDNFEKDGSSGNISGRLDKGIIKLLYSFRSEGMNSVMEVYFKKQGDALIRGTGEMATRGDTSYFVNPAKIDFPPDDKMSKIPCDELQSSFNR